MYRTSLSRWTRSTIAVAGVLALGSVAQAGSNWNWDQNWNNCPPDQQDQPKTCFDLSTEWWECDQQQDSFIFTEDGLTLTVTALSIDDNNQFHLAEVDQNSDGLGVCNGDNDNTDALDSSGWKDVLIFSFSQPVEIKTLEFTQVNWGDDARFYEGFTLLGDIDLGDYKPWYSDTADVDVSDLSFALNGSLFGLTLADGCDAFRIQELCVTAAPTPAAAGAGLVMLGLASLRRRRSAS